MVESSSARETRLMFENMGLVISIVKKFTKDPSEFQDLVQIGSIGLLKAIRKLKEEKACLSTWAYKHIRWEIIRHIDRRDNNKFISIDNISEPSYSSDIDDLENSMPDYLSSDEQEVLTLRCKKYTLKEICNIMDLKSHVVNKILKQAIGKIKISNEEKTHLNGH